MTSYAELWAEVLNKLNTGLLVNERSIESWLKNNRILSIENDIVEIEVEDETAKKIIINKYEVYIKKVLRSLTENDDLKCKFVPKQFNSESTLFIKNEEEKENKEKPVFTNSLVGLNPKYTFENFVIGSNNALAHAAAKSVSQHPATKYNPLFIYGGPGLGKSHLLHAIALSILKDKPHLKVCYIATETYLNEMIQAISKNNTEGFKQKYRDIDILLIDDIQFLSKKTGTQEEFFHNFNELYNNGKQIVISSDRPPKEINHLEERLRTRFEWGLLADIQTPDIETREAILRRKAEVENIKIDPEIINYIALRIKSSIRALEAALTRLKGMSELLDQPITLSLAKTQLKDLFDTNVNKKVTTLDIMKKIANRYDISVDNLKSSSRQKNIAQARFVAIYLCRKLTNLTQEEIGKDFGNRDHSTVLNAVNKVEKMIKTDEEFSSNINELIKEMQN